MYLFLDTETTGLSRRTDHVVQIAWVLTDAAGNIKAEECHVIRPNGYSIPPAAARIHGITTAKACEIGQPLGLILERLSDAAMRATIVVAHKLDFDLGILQHSYKIASLPYPLHGKTQICTMKLSTTWCRLPKLNGLTGFKWPKLDELHYRLFGEGFDGAHDALADTHACRKCYFQLVSLGVITPPSIPVQKKEPQKVEQEPVSGTIPRSSPSGSDPDSSHGDIERPESIGHGVSNEIEVVGVDQRQESVPQQNDDSHKPEPIPQQTPASSGFSGLWYWVSGVIVVLLLWLLGKDHPASPPPRSSSQAIAKRDVERQVEEQRSVGADQQQAEQQQETSDVKDAEWRAEQQRHAETRRRADESRRLTETKLRRDVHLRQIKPDKNGKDVIAPSDSMTAGKHQPVAMSPMDAVRLDDERALQEAILRGEDVDGVYGNGSTPLIAAINQRKRWAVELLLAAGANPDKADTSGNVPIYYANRVGNWGIRGELVSYLKKATLPRPTYQSITMAAANKDAVDVELFLRKGVSPNDRVYGALPIASAAEAGALDVVKVLVHYGANPNNTDGYGRSALFYAEMNGRKDVTQYLKSIGVRD